MRGKWLGWIFLVLLSGAVGAVPNPPGGGRQPLREMRERYEARRQEVALKLSTKRSELANLLARDDVEKANVKAKLQEIMELEHARQELMVDEFFEAKTLLKPHQWEAYRRRVLKHLLNERRGQ